MKEQQSSTGGWQYCEAQGCSSSRGYPMVEGMMTQGWVAIIYTIMDRLKKPSFVNQLIEVSFRLMKLRISINLIHHQLVSNVQWLASTVSHGRTLLCAFAFEMKKVPASEEPFQARIAGLLEDSGISWNLKDDYGCSALHYACLWHNLSLVKRICSYDPDLILDVDRVGRTPLMSAFWNYKKNDGTFVDTIKFLCSLKGHMKAVNKLSITRPLSQLAHGYCRRRQVLNYLEPILVGQDEANALEVTPLIVAAIHCDVEMVRFLIQSGASPNVPDSRGKTPLMYAVQTNSEEVVLALLGCDEHRKNVGNLMKELKGRRGVLRQMNEIDVNARDNQGWNALHHAVCVREPGIGEVFFDNDLIIRILVDCGIDTMPHSPDSPILLAKKMGSIVNFMSELGKGNVAEVINDLDESSFRTFTSERRWVFPYNVKDDAAKMLRELELAERDKELNEKNAEKRPPSGCSAGRDSTLFEDYDILMSNVNPCRGFYGKYSFYRMQIWQEAPKDLWILFTNWGRIGGGCGQFQNTPFTSSDEAVDEFKKIFRSKTKNDWDERSNFHQSPRFYRPVKLDPVKMIKRADIRFDLESSVPSKLPAAIQDVMKGLANTTTLVNAHRDVGLDVAKVPFGRIDRGQVERAKDVLGMLKKAIKEKGEMDKKNVKGSVDELSQITILRKVLDLSEEYFWLMPTTRFEYEKLEPIDDISALKKEEDRVAIILEMETSERLLLGARYRKAEMNPLDYIYHGLDCKLELLDPEKNEHDRQVSNLVSMYYRNHDNSNRDVVEVFRVEISAELEKFPRIRDGKVFKSSHQEANRCLLWHGTKAENLLSILHSGLKVHSSLATFTGRCYGDGIYFAKSSRKSISYTNSPIPGGSSRFLLLGDVALGQLRNLQRLGSGFSQYDSLVVPSWRARSPFGTCRASAIGGLHIELGATDHLDDGPLGSHSLDNVEYIACNENQAVVRYMVVVKQQPKEAV